MTALIVFSHLRWGSVFQRPQQLMSRLARDRQVLFIEEPLLDTNGPARLESISYGPNLQVLRPRTPVAAPGFHDEQLPVLMELLSAHLRRQAIDDYAVWFYTPMALPLITHLNPRAVVYDCMDELAAFPNAPRQLRQRETALLKMANLVFTSGPALYQAKRSLGANVQCLCNAVDARHFSPAWLRAADPHAGMASALHAGIARPRLGYFGSIDERIDFGLLQRLADARPGWQIVMVGPVARAVEARLPQRP